MCVLCLVYSSISYNVFFLSSRRRHTRCALVTGVQTCALPISPWLRLKPVRYVTHILCDRFWSRIAGRKAPGGEGSKFALITNHRIGRAGRRGRVRRGSASPAKPFAGRFPRSEERRVGKECGSSFRDRCSPYH